MIGPRPLAPGLLAKAWARAFAACFVAIILTVSEPSKAAASPDPAPSQSTALDPQMAPPQIRQLLSLLADPQVQNWLEKQRSSRTAAGPAQVGTDTAVSHYFASRVAAMREHMIALATALPGLPARFEHAADLLRIDVAECRPGLLLLLFLALGLGAEWLFRKATGGVRRHLDQHPLMTVNDRLRVVATRLAFAAGRVGAFAAGSVGPFLALDWPPLLREIVFGYLVAFVAIRVAAIIGHFLLAPGDERFRVIPTDRWAARFWWRRLVGFVGWFALGLVTVELLGVLGFPLPERQLVAYALGLGLLSIALETVWRRPVSPKELTESASPESRHFGRVAQNALLSSGIVLLWVLWVAKAMPAFWLVLVIIALPLAIIAARRAVEHLLRPPGSARLDVETPTVVTVCLERGLRALLLIGAVLLLGWGWGVDMIDLAGQHTLVARLAHGVLSAVVVLLVADVLWQAARAAIDCKLAEAADPGQPNTEEARRRARIRTLLPIFRNILFIAVIAVTAMMALAALGVEIGPLIAGAGVVGVAIGFGAQTFVRDVIAGMFYLLDDAFRVGEYIQSGNYKGTVEGFSIRSVKLRHHRGPLYTVPFGLLGAVQNQSRDWVIDKLTVGITYDSDLERARKLIKQIGLELAQDPEFAPLIIEPLKMQGVEQFGDFAVQIRMKMMTLPGEQFVIRRKAYAMIKKAFDTNGIKFAYPTVQIAGEGEASSAAVAQRALELTRPAVA